jgi:hypothetical protein
MTGWLTALRDRPIAEQERHIALAATAAVLIAATVLLALTRPTTPAATARAADKASTTTTATVDPGPLAPATSPGNAPSAEAVAVSRSFLTGYLAYAYGSAPASQIADAARSLIASLEAHPPRVTSAMHASRPRVLEVHATPEPSGQLGMSAVVNDGGVIDYTLGLTLAPQDGRLLVTAVEQD